jgi:hypothetical protein
LSDPGGFTTITKLSRREFNQGMSGAKKVAKRGPVFITERGRPAHVLPRIGAHEKLSGRQASIVERLAMPGGDATRFEPLRLRGTIRRTANLR